MNNSSGQKSFTLQGSWLYAFWKFSRPHTIIGTSLSVLGLYLIAIAVSSTSISAIHLDQFLGQFLPTWISCLCGNIYIVGLNQLEDIDIDKINKPHLPLAAGEFSYRTGQIIVIAAGVLALILAGLTGTYLLGMVTLSLAIGTAYSLPPIRLKQYPLWAALCIFSVRGTIVNLGLFLHFNWSLQKVSSIPPAVWILTLFILVFTLAIAIFKDIPDMEGDRLYNINTFTIQLGQQTVFNIALWVLTTCYLGLIIVGILPIAGINSLFLSITHAIILIVMWFQSRSVDFKDKRAVTQFYQFIWKLFFLEYLIYPLACLWA